MYVIWLLVINTCFAWAQSQQFVATDIANFWDTYDKITTTDDTTKQRQYLKQGYLDKGTIGLQSLIQVRNYSEDEFLLAIRKYPNFWNSLRANTLNVQAHYPEIEANIAALKAIYPDLRPSTIYFLIGAFRTNGTILQDRVLIGSEMALGDENTDVAEHPDFRQLYYKTYKPKQNLALLCAHEYVHTQQKDPVSNLLSYCIYEGVAEFMSCLATGQKSNTPSIEFGKANQEKVLQKFQEELFFYRLEDWLWGENTNELKERDLGYYIGYEICERYYHLSLDKQKAVKELIELDYADENAVERIVDATKIFPVSLGKIWEDYNAQRPTVIGIKPFNKNQKVKPGLVQISIYFSEEMDTNFRGFDYGPLGENHLYRFNHIIGWSNNNQTFAIEVEVDADKKYQALITSNFRNKKGARLQPYLLEFETKAQ